MNVLIKLYEMILVYGTKIISFTNSCMNALVVNIKINRTKFVCLLRCFPKRYFPYSYSKVNIRDYLKLVSTPIKITGHVYPSVNILS